MQTIDTVLSAVKVGTRVLNHGDVCNPSHHGTVTAIDHSGWGVNIWVQPDQQDVEDDTPYSVYWTAFTGPHARLEIV